MVVFFHTNAIVHTYSDTLSWKISVMEQCVVDSAIPIFFMLTGAKLMEYRSRYSTKEYIKNRLRRIGIPFIFWNVFYLIYQRVLSPDASFHSAKEFVSMFLQSEFQKRYWFFFPLFSIYAAIPVVSLILQVKGHRKLLWYTVYVGFGLHWVLQPLCALLGITYNSYLSMPICGGFMVYVLFGYLISTEQWRRWKRIVLYLLAAVGGILAVGYTIFASAAAEETVRSMFSYRFFPSALTGAAIFVFVKHLLDKPALIGAIGRHSKLVKLIRTVSSCCMGVWLTHSLAIAFATVLLDLSTSSYVFRFVLPPFLFASCVIGVWIVKKIPVLKHIV